jgi:hypothetical protein
MSATILILGCLIWVPLVFWVLSLIHWMIQGDIDAGSGLVGILFGFGMGYTAVKPPIPILSPIAFCLVVGTIVFFPFLRMSLDRRQFRNIEIEGVEKAYEAIGQRPDNPFAKFKLAQSVYRLGMIGHGVALADSVMASVPERIAQEEHRLLKKWIAAGVPPETLRPIQCIECRSLCQPGWTHCRNCGAPFLLHRAKGKIMPAGHARMLMAIWAAMVLAAIGIPAATALPPALALPAMALILVGAVLFVVLTHRFTQAGAA